MRTIQTDVVVVGAGNAGLTAALAAYEVGAGVIVLEAATESERGGNSRFSGGIFRTTHDGLDDLRTLLDKSSDRWLERGVSVDAYTAADYTADWQKTSAGRANRSLVDLTVQRSLDTIRWMKRHGVVWELSADKMWDPDKIDKGKSIVLPPGGALRAAGEGVGLMARLFAAAERADGIDVWYNAPSVELITDGYTVRGVVVNKDDERVNVLGRVVLASGGFEANPEMRRRYLGEGWDLVKVRGTRHNMGIMLQRALDAGAQPVGNWGGAHAVAIDANAPEVGDLSLTDKMSRYSYPYALLVNSNGKRFVDEGEDQVWLTYAKNGWAVRAQEFGVAYQIFDQASINLLEPRYSTATPVCAPTIAELASALGLPVGALTETVETFNQAVSSDANAKFDAARPDGVSAQPAGQPNKSNWARRIEVPPFTAYPVTCGITFTYGGVKVNASAEVISTVGKPIANLWAAGETVGDYFYFNYAAGAGLMRGAVFGRMAGTNAARVALFSQRSGETTKVTA
jgi:tricarballylate dehydrogenase